MFILVSFADNPQTGIMSTSHDRTLICRQTKFADLVQISPEDFSKHSIVAIEDNINAKYANKVGHLPVHLAHRPPLNRNND